jgi:hypothetical protein
VWQTRWAPQDHRIVGLKGAFGVRGKVGQRFSLIDAMVLIAELALGFRLIRGLSLGRFLIKYDPVGPMSPRYLAPWTRLDWFDWAVQTALNRFYFVLPILATLTVAVVLLRLRPPRPRLARLLRQPGIAASVAATSAIALWVPAVGAWATRRNLDEYQSLVFLTISAGSAVASCWTILLIGGRWRPDPGWGDRVGRVLGIVWLAPIPLYLLETILVY